MSQTVVRTLENVCFREGSLRLGISQKTCHAYFFTAFEEKAWDDFSVHILSVHPIALFFAGNAKAVPLLLH